MAMRELSVSSLEPKYPSTFLYFTDVTEAQLALMAAATSKAEVKELLKECMKIDQPEGFRTDILVDMHYHNYSFCVQRGFTPEKTSTLISIMKLVLEESISQRLVPEAAFDLFKDWLLKHSVERPPWSVGVFSFDNIKLIIEYMHNTFFRHYRLYMYAFMTHCNLSVQVDSLDKNIAQFLDILQLSEADEVDPRAQPELMHLFKPSEKELAEAELRKLQSQPADKATLIKQRVDDGVRRLMESFEDRLKDQDARFRALRQG